MVESEQDGSEGVTRFIRAARDGENTQDRGRATEQLWLQCLGRVEGYARKLCRRVGLQHLPDTDHDVAMSAMGSVINGLQQGRWPDLQDTEALWKLLYTITRRKCYRAIDKELKQKPLSTDDEDKQWMEPTDFADQSEIALKELLSSLGPSTDDWLTAEPLGATEIDGRLLERVADRAGEQLAGNHPPEVSSLSELGPKQKQALQFRQIALLKILGYTNKQIKAITGIPNRTIDLRLRIIREKWRHILEDG